MAFYTSKNGLIQVSVQGVTLDSTSWDTMEGGELTAENQVYNPGNMAPSIAVGGIRKRGDITITRAWSDFLIGKYINLDNSAGVAAMTVKYTPKTTATASGTTITYTGLLATVSRPNYESSNSNIVYLSLVMTPNETIS